MFVVMGITGNTGAAAAQTLLAGGHRVRAVVRDADRAASWAARGVDLVEGDATSASSLTAAFSGARGAYVLAPPPYADPEPLRVYERVAEAVRDAVAASGLERLVFLSSEGAQHEAGTGPIAGLHRAETILAAHRDRITFLRAAFFQENWAAVLGAAAEQGILPTMLADLARKRPMVATADIGRVAADLLVDPSPPALVELAGPEDYSANDAAQAVSAALGREVTPVQPPREAWESILAAAGLSGASAALIAQMYDGINSGHVAFSGDAPLRRGGVTLARTLADLVGRRAG